MDRKTLAAALVISLAVSLVPLRQTQAWWTEGHRLMTQEAIKLIPDPEWRQFFEHYAYFLNETCVWPDSVYKAEDPKEEPRHYYDLEIPPDKRTYRDGALPEAVYNFTIAMAEAIKEGDWFEALALAGRVAHYVEDAHQPYHCTVNYNPLGKHGLADSLVEKHWNELTLDLSAPIEPIDNLTAFIFEIIYDSNSKVARLNATLIGDPDDPNDDKEWSDDLRDLISEQASRAIVAVARVWWTAITMADARPPDLSASYSISVDLVAPEKVATRMVAVATVLDGLEIPLDADVTWTFGQDTGTARRADVGVYKISIDSTILQKYAGQTVTLTVKASKSGYGEAEASAQVYVEPIEVPTPPPERPGLPIMWIVVAVVVVAAVIVVIVLLRRRS